MSFGAGVESARGNIHRNCRIGNCEGERGEKERRGGYQCPTFWNFRRGNV